MKVKEQVLLREHTTFKIGGPATLFIVAESVEELPAAYALARTHALPVYPLGEGSNLLAGDEEIRRAIVHLSTEAISYEEQVDGVLVRADGGVSWDALVTETAQKGLWGLENLAGIPGTVGAAPVQNIGAYGREVKDTIVSVEAYDSETDAFITFSNEDCGFAYRDSRFKQKPGLYIVRVAFTLSKTPMAELSYPDLKSSTEKGVVLETPIQIAEEVRAIRARKFPDLQVTGTAGSFFKNPRVTKKTYAELKKRYPELPGFESPTEVKIPLAWILDHVLNLRGFSLGPASLFEKQPLVLVVEKGATAHDVNTLASFVEERVHATTGIRIEREVPSLT